MRDGEGRILFTYDVWSANKLKVQHIGHTCKKKVSNFRNFLLLLFTVANVTWKMAVRPISSTAIVEPRDSSSMRKI